jgi:hypothetical protein
VQDNDTYTAEKKYNYVYKQTRDNGEYYIGIHSDDNMDDNYNGSGTVFKNKYKADPDSFTKTILCYRDTREEASNMEAVLVTKETIEEPLCLNLISGGTSGWTPSEEWIAAVSLRMIGNTNGCGAKRSDEWKRNQAVRNAGNTYGLGNVHRDDSKQLMSERAKISQLGNTNRRDKKKYTIVSSEHGEFTGAPYEIRAEYPQYTWCKLSSLVNDKQATCHGFSLKK